MFFTKKSVISVLLALILVFSMVSPASATEATPRASDYLMSYSAYVYPAGWGKVEVWISVDGVEYMDEIGALSIYLYESVDNENWSLKKTFHYSDYPDMLGYNDVYHIGHIEYAGTIGRYYKAYVSVWAGKDGDGDTRYFWTSPKKATLFAASTG